MARTGGHSKKISVTYSVQISHVAAVVAKIDKVLAVPLEEDGLGGVTQCGHDFPGVLAEVLRSQCTRQAIPVYMGSY
jgi:hypothetical protein